MFSISNNNNINPNILELMNLTELKIGVEAEIIGCDDDNLSNTLYEMGLVPGEIVMVEKYSPLGDPIQIHINNNDIIIRKNEAKHLIIKVLY
jgi:ferrous iron transport protein A